MLVFNWLSSKITLKENNPERIILILSSKHKYKRKFSRTTSCTSTLKFKQRVRIGDIFITVNFQRL